MDRIRTKVRYKHSFAFMRADVETASILKNDKVFTTKGCHAIIKFPFHFSSVFSLRSFISSLHTYKFI